MHGAAWVAVCQGERRYPSLRGRALSLTRRMQPELQCVLGLGLAGVPAGAAAAAADRSASYMPGRARGWEDLVGVGVPVAYVQYSRGLRDDHPCCHIVPRNTDYYYSRWP